MNTVATPLDRRPGSTLGRLPLPVVATIALAWGLVIAAQAVGGAGLVHHDELIEHGPGAVAAAGLFLLAWQVMIAAMMLPSSLPLVRLFRSASAGAPRSGLAMAAFVGGYAVVWSAFGVLAFGLDVAVHALVSASGWLGDRDWLLGGAVLALAGAFQFTSLKDACLDRCRHPAQFLIRFYARGPGGGFRLGARHGVFCVGCCWALMLVMFAVGMTSLVWMALLTAVMVHEKTRPAGRDAVPVTGVALLALASVVIAYGAYASGA